MERLFLIEHSLKDEGGHHFDYTRLISQAALQQGCQVVIGANRRMSPSCDLPEGAEIRPLFRQSAYCKFSIIAGLAELTRNTADQWPWAPLKSSRSLKARWDRHRWIRRRVRWIDDLSNDLRKFLRSYSFTDQDHILVSTASEIEVIALTHFLAVSPHTLPAHWHFQFHFAIARGRPTEYEAQRENWAQLRHTFRAALARVPYHRFGWYCTTDELVDQYNRLGCVQFKPLCYPADPALLDALQATGVQQDHNSPSPLRLTVAGATRREKGQKQHLQQVANIVYGLNTQREPIKLVVQRASSRWPRSSWTLDKPATRELPQHEASNEMLGQLQSSAIAPSRSNSYEPLAASSISEMVEWADHPLPPEKYRQLIYDADAGLFLYDGYRYYARRAGVLGEFLVAGKPVIVPAGCWLGEQIDSQRRKHVARCIDRAVTKKVLQADQLKSAPTNVPLPGGLINFDREHHPYLAEASIEPGYHAAVVIFHWHWPAQPGAFARVEVRQSDATGNTVAPVSTQIVGHPGSGQHAMCLLPLHAQAASLALRLTNAFEPASVSVRQLQVQLLQMPDAVSPPQSAVGVTYADMDHLPQAIEELVAHHQHYASTAQEFAPEWFARHDPQRTLGELEQSSTALQRAA